MAPTRNRILNADRPKILAIDDTPANLMVLASGLASEYAFQLATSAEEGLAMAEAAPPDLILLDVMMPEVDGFEACRRLQAHPRLKAVPVIFITALDDIGAEVSGLGLGAVDYLHKPINVDVARQRFANLIDRDRLGKEVARYRDHLEELVAQRTQELQHANVELRAAQVVAECARRAKSTFLANMSHELRTPLNIILGMNELIRHRLTDLGLQEKNQKLSLAARQLLSIINNILQLSRLEGDTASLTAERFSLRDLLDSLLLGHTREAQAKGLTLRPDLPADLPGFVHGLPAGIKQVLENLLSNAIKFSERGQITLRAQVGPADPEGRLLLRLEVEDQGIGIPAAESDRLFEEFTQADESNTRKYGGVGIGLAISRQLATLMGGRIGVRSRLHKGSCFWLAVPLRLADSGTTEIPAPPAISAVTGPQANPTVAPPTPAPAPDIDTQLEQLLGLLTCGDLEALNRWDLAYPLLAPHLGANAERCDLAIRRFAFDEAITLLQGLPTGLSGLTRPQGAAGT